jgi:hypothetical protein
MKPNYPGRKPKPPQSPFETKGVTWDTIGLDIWTAEARRYLTRCKRFQQWAGEADLIVGCLMRPYLLAGSSPDRVELALRFTHLLAEDPQAFTEMCYRLLKRVAAWRRCPEMQATVALAWLQNFKQLRPTTRREVVRRLGVTTATWRGSAQSLVKVLKSLGIKTATLKIIEHARERLRSY